MMKSSATKVNPDLAKERAKASFDTTELIYFLHGGQQKTERKRLLGKLSGHLEVIGLSIMYQSNRSLNIPLGQPPCICIFGKFLFKFPPPEAVKLFKCPILGPFQVIKCPHPRETFQKLLLCSGSCECEQNTLTRRR